MLAALTLLPALLGLIGDRVNALRIPIIGTRSIEETNVEGRFWVGSSRASSAIRGSASWPPQRCSSSRPSPRSEFTIGANSISTLPDSFSSKRAFLALQRDFPAATTDPVRIVVPEGHNRTEVSQRLRDLQRRLAEDPRFGAGSIRLSSNGDAAVLVFPGPGDPAGERAVAAVRSLRDNVVPAAFDGAGVEALVGGTSSESVDYFDGTSDPAPYVFVFVLGLTFVLLTIAFRSIVVAATSVALNLLSVAAAYGLLVLVFQQGVGAGLFGFQQVDVIEAWVPLFLFSCALRTLDGLPGVPAQPHPRALRHTRRHARSRVVGVSSTARLITGAALIIVAVFLGFAMGDLVMFQQMGFGVAVALLIDATIIRSVLVPATMTLLGRWNWYLPHRLEWLPRVHVESPARTTRGPRTRPPSPVTAWYWQRRFLPFNERWRSERAPYAG